MRIKFYEINVEATSGRFYDPIFGFKIAKLNAHESKLISHTHRHENVEEIAAGSDNTWAHFIDEVKVDRR